MTLRPERTLHLAPSPVDVIQAAGRAYLNSAGTSIEIPLADIPRIIAALIVAEDRLSDAATEAWT